MTPYANVPGASILVRTPTIDGTPDLTGVTLGGGSALASDDSRWTAEGANETMWNAGGRRHRFHTSLWARADGLQQEGNANLLGTYAFNSVADFAANRATSFTRTLTQPERSGSVWNSAAAFSHQWAPTRFFSLLYGARVEADGFASAPAKNPALEQALGVETGLAPSRLHVSPRAGFTFQYNRDRDNGNGLSQSQVGRFFRSSYGVVRGGIGEFRDILRPQILADASAATGLAGGTSVLSCVGSAVPSPDWTRFVADPTSVPTQCVDGSGVLADRSPSVTLIDRGYDTPRSWRGSLDWTTSWHNWTTRVSGLASYDLSQPGTVDANFAGTPKFTLGDEGNRPVFVSTASIDPLSGAVSSTESRRSNLFGRVASRVSDLRGYGEQLTFVVAPDPFKVRLPAQLYASVGYTLQSSRRQFRGFDGASFGDPRVVEWAAESARCAPRDRSLRRLQFGEDGIGHAVLAHSVRPSVHADRAGRRRRRRTRRRSRIHPQSRARDRSGAGWPDPIVARLRFWHGTRVSARESRPGGAAQWVPRSVDAVAQCAVASADPWKVHRARDAERLPPERSRRNG